MCALHEPPEITVRGHFLVSSPVCEIAHIVHGISIIRIQKYYMGRAPQRLGRANGGRGECLTVCPYDNLNPSKNRVSEKRAPLDVERATVTSSWRRRLASSTLPYVRA